MANHLIAQTVFAIALGASTAVSAATPPAPQQPVPPIAQVSITNVEGSISYRERILMPAGSLMTVQVLDVSRPGASAETVTEVSYTLDGSAPAYGYRLRVFNDQLEPNHTYAVRAEIRDPSGRLAFTTDQRHEVLTRGAPNEAHLVLVRVSGS